MLADCCDRCRSKIPFDVIKGAMIRRCIRVHDRTLCEPCAWNHSVCEVCGDSVGMMMPGPKPWDNRLPFCSLSCYEKWKATRSRSEPLDSHLVSRDLKAEEQLGKRMTELSAYVRKPSSVDDLARPYVTTGPYSAWPQSNLNDGARRELAELLDRVVIVLPIRATLREIEERVTFAQ